MPNFYTLLELHAHACALQAEIYDAMDHGDEPVTYELSAALACASKTNRALYALIVSHPANPLKEK